MYSVPEQVAYSGVQGVSFSGLLCSYAMDLFILKVRLCKGFSLTPALRTRPFLFRIFFFSVEIKGVQSRLCTLMCHVKWNLITCSHSLVHIPKVHLKVNFLNLKTSF